MLIFESSFYKNSDVPVRWKNKIDYHYTVLKIIEDDNNFHDFMYKSQSNTNPNNKTTDHSLNHSNVSICSPNNNSNIGLPYITENTRENYNGTSFSRINRSNNYGEGEINKNTTNLKFNTTFRERERYEKSNANWNNLSLKSLNNCSRRLDEFTAKNPSLTTYNQMNTSKNLFELNNKANLSTKQFNMSTSNSDLIKKTHNKSFKTTFHDPIITGKSFATSNKNESEFLNIVTNKKIELKNENVKQLYGEVNRSGPNYQYCEKCSNKNLEFFQELKPENAIKLLNFIKTYRQTHGYNK